MLRGTIYLFFCHGGGLTFDIAGKQTSPLPRIEAAEAGP